VRVYKPVGLLCGFCFASIALSVELGTLPEGAEPKAKMRSMDRDWHYFQSIPCKDVAKLKFHSRSEEMLIAKRKSQCLKQFDAFFSKPIEQ